MPSSLTSSWPTRLADNLVHGKLRGVSASQLVGRCCDQPLADGDRCQWVEFDRLDSRRQISLGEPIETKERLALAARRIGQEELNSDRVI